MEKLSHCSLTKEQQVYFQTIINKVNSFLLTCEEKWFSFGSLIWKRDYGFIASISFVSLRNLTMWSLIIIFRTRWNSMTERSFSLDSSDRFAPPLRLLNPKPRSIYHDDMDTWRFFTAPYPSTWKCSLIEIFSFRFSVNVDRFWFVCRMIIVNMLTLFRWF